MTQGWIGIDIDGTLAHYDGWRGPDHFGAVIEPMRLRLDQWRHAGVEVRIFTARACDPSLVPSIQRWLDSLGLGDVAITHRKDYHLLQIWDDRAIEVETNTGVILTPRDNISLFHAGWVGVELDGTLAHATPDMPAPPDAIGEPIGPMLMRVKQWLLAGMRLKLFTARAGDPKQHPLLRDWLDHHGLHAMEFTCEKDFDMSQFWDDRAVHVVCNSGDIVTTQQQLIPSPRYRF